MFKVFMCKVIKKLKRSDDGSRAGFTIFKNPREGSSRSRIFLFSLVYVCIRVVICVMPPGETKNDTELKFGTHTPLDHI